MTTSDRNMFLKSQLLPEQYHRKAVQGCLQANRVHSKACEALMRRELRRAELNRAVFLTELYTTRAGDQCCELRKSQTHGLGVFATRLIAKGDAATFYPADAIVVCPPKPYFANKVAAMLPFANVTEQDVAVYALVVQPHSEEQCAVSVVGKPLALDRSEGHLCGHMVNDAASLHSASGTAAYLAAAFSGRNVEYEIDRGTITLRATRDIAAGDELFAAYGANYWLSAAARTSR